MNAQNSTRRIVALGALWASISGAALLAPGCYGRNCEGGTETFGTEPGQGEMIDENTWESNPIDGDWLWFPRQRYYIFEIRALGGRTPRRPVPYISGLPNPLKNGSDLSRRRGTSSSSTAVPNRIDVRNDTCSDFYLRLEIDVRPLPPPAPTPDAGADGTVADAAVDDDDAAADAGDAEGGN